MFKYVIHYLVKDNFESQFIYCSFVMYKYIYLLSM